MYICAGTRIVHVSAEIMQALRGNMENNKDKVSSSTWLIDDTLIVEFLLCSTCCMPSSSQSGSASASASTFV